MKPFNCVVYNNEVRVTVDHILNLLLNTASILTTHKRPIGPELLGLYAYAPYDSILRRCTYSVNRDDIFTRIIGDIGRVKIDIDITTQSMHIKCKRGRTTDFHVIINQQTVSDKMIMTFVKTYDKTAIKTWFPWQYDQLLAFEQMNSGR